MRGPRLRANGLALPADRSFLAAMLPAWRNLRATVPGSFLASLVLAVGYLAFVAWDQSHWWRTKPDYGFGWLAPLCVAFVVHDRWAATRSALAQCAHDGSPRAVGWQRLVLWLLIGAALILGILFFLLGSFYRAGAGSSQPGTLAITLGAAGILPALLFINAPVSPAPRPGGFWSDARVRLVALFVFPILVWLVSAPMVSVVESQLNRALLRQVVTVVAFVFDTLGFPLEQRGNVLALPSGDVGVADACSGIRSLTGCLFAGSFVAAVFVDRSWKKIALIAAALLLAFVSNIGRSLFLTAWAYQHGATAIGGAVHDIAGYAVLGVTVVGLFVLQWVLNWRVTQPPDAN